MQSDLLRFLGLMRKAGKLSLGEQGTGQAARSGKAKLIFLAGDASENALDRAEGFSRMASVPLIRLHVTKSELASSLSVAGGSMGAVCDEGFAKALMEKFPDDMVRI